MLNKHNLKLKSAHYGFFPQKDLETSNRYGSHYIGHPTHQVNGVGQNTGTLGHRLAVAVGIALAGKMSGVSNKDERDLPHAEFNNPNQLTH
jgi:transketolase N-terminal domain/subunit